MVKVDKEHGGFLRIIARFIINDCSTIMYSYIPLREEIFNETKVFPRDRLRLGCSISCWRFYILDIQDISFADIAVKNVALHT